MKSQISGLFGTFQDQWEPCETNALRPLFSNYCIDLLCHHPTEEYSKYLLHTISELI